MLFIPIKQLKTNMKLDHDVMVFEGSNARLLPKGEVLTERFINRLQKFDIPGVYIKDEISGDIVPSKPLLSNKIKTQSLSNLEWVFKNSTEITEKTSARYMEHLDKTVLELIDLVNSDESNLVNISDLRAYDEYTYHHSLSVAVVSLAIGNQLRLSSTELHKLGFAAILHDIGKMDIPIEIINKTAKLTEEEFSIVKDHAILGENHLDRYNINDSVISTSVIHHHEKLDGTGYPHGLKNDEIPYFSKIISVADVYDALTSRRPYRNPQLPSQVAEYIMGNCGSSFDMEIVHAMLRKIEFFPVGSFVEFNDGRKAVVLDNENSLHPVVKLFDEPHDVLDLFNDTSTYSMVITKHYEVIPSDQISRIDPNASNTAHLLSRTS